MVAESVEKQDATSLAPVEVQGLSKLHAADAKPQPPQPSQPQPSQPQQPPQPQQPAQQPEPKPQQQPAPQPQKAQESQVVPAKVQAPPPWVLQILYRKDVQAVENVIKISDGRDKACKLVQYGGRLLVWYLMRFDAIAKNSTAKAGLDQLEGVCGHVSKIRKVLRICKWGYEMPNARKHIRDYATKKTPFEKVYGALRILNSFLGMGTDFIDDLNLYTSWGLLPKLVQTTLEPIGPKFWLGNVLFDLSFLSHEIYNMECEYKELEAKLRAADKADEKTCAKLGDELAALFAKKVAKYIAWTKLFGDLIVALNNALNMNWSKGVVQGGGLLSGICSFYKLYQNAYTALK